MTLQEWAPITFSMGFLEASRDRVSEALIACVRGQADGRQPRVSQLHEPFPDVLRQLAPLTMLTWRASSRLRRPARGQPISTMVHGVRRRRAKCRGLAIRQKPHTIGTPGIQRGVAGSAMFELFGPTRGEFLNYVRTVAAAWDGDRWIFQQTGTPQAFEDQTRHQARLVRDRFTPETLVEYCQALGVDPYNPGFYRSEASRPGGNS